MRASRLIAAMCAAEVFTMAGVFAFPALLPIFFTEWGLTNTEAGWISGIYFVGYAGNGLGLAIVKAIAESHDGQVAAENTAQGAQFTLQLPTADWPLRNGHPHRSLDVSLQWYQSLTAIAVTLRHLIRYTSGTIQERIVFCKQLFNWMRRKKRCVLAQS